MPRIKRPAIIFHNMQFDYEIPVEEYAAAHVLYYKASANGRALRQALACLLLGSFFVLIAVSRWAADWAPILLLVTGAWLIYCGIKMLFPTRYYRRYYVQSGLAGKKYHAELDKDGFLVSGDGCSWRVLWTEARVSGEDKRVFMFYGKSTIFIFGKRYLTEDQQRGIRELAAGQGQLA